ncbi:MAG: 3'(2'),5'-bisphosphate nucleotidase CysQ [Chitinophagales bacterium]|nr:3'(2'),5'-bisphosphate nucleotidase CysQ [Chitinophagales bacterium]
MNLDTLRINELIQVAIEAGNEILKIYDRDFEVVNKADNSPLTEADKVSNEVIVEGLERLYPNIPIVSEENKLTDFSVRSQWDWCWMVDPLDGTKEFIKKNGEFTVNIALVHQGDIVAGIVYVPVQNKTFYAIQEKGAFLIDGHSTPRLLRIRPLAEDGVLKVVGSRSHNSQEVDDFIDTLRKEYDNIDFVAAGSSLKFCLVAEGIADIYPRLAPTMEWDTAAGQIVATEAGAQVLKYPELSPLVYNKENLLNPFFIVLNPKMSVSK